MTTDEHDNLILAKCRSLLALAAKRTPGRWKSVANHKPFKIVWIEKGDGYSTSDLIADDSDYIAVCAGSAEAGWLSTIAAIEGLQAAESLIYSVQNDYDDSPTRWWIEQRTKVVGALEAIRSAWPKELL